MKLDKLWHRNSVLGCILAIFGVGIAILVFPMSGGDRNHIADMDIEQIGGVWFVPPGESDTEVIWLDPKNIEPLYDLLSSQTTERSPSNWQYIGRVGFTYPNGRVASVKLYDTKTERGAFSCGSAWFRYDGRLPKCIGNAR